MQLMCSPMLQTLCGQMLRVAIARVPAAEAAQYILAEADRQSRGASGKP